jgi:hypothetical protein
MIIQITKTQIIETRTGISEVIPVRPVPNIPDGTSE